MADITSPIILDSTGQDIVTALGNVVSAITGPSAADVTYDGTTSGLSATDVQNAIDEVVTEKQDVLTFDATPTENSTNPVTSGGVYDALAVKSDITAIAPDESGNTVASQAYSVGEHFYKDGYFCTVTSAIASGDTLTEGTNYTEGNIADELSKSPTSSTITATSSNISISSSYNKVYKVGNVVSFKIRITVNTAITNDADETLFSVPYTPVLTNQVFQVISANAPWTDAGFGAYLTTSKNMIVKANISTGSYDIHGIYVTTD